jgi:polar amino acid transport system substrate-binding protein
MFLKLIFSFNIILLVAAPGQAANQRSVLVMDLELIGNLRPSLTPLLSELTLKYLQSSGRFTIYGQRDLGSMLQLDAARAVMGCEKEVCGLEKYKPLNSELLVAGTLGQLADKYIVNMKVIDTQSGVVLARSTQLIEANEALLPKALKAATNDLVAAIDVGPQTTSPLRPQSDGRRTVRVGGYVFPPFLDRDEGGRWTGLTLKLIEKLNSLQRDYKFVFVPTTPTERYQDFDAGKYDVLFFENPAWGWSGRDVVTSRTYLTGGEVYVARSSAGRDQRFFSNIQNRRLLGIYGYHYGLTGFVSDPRKLARSFFLKLTDSHLGNLQDVLADRADVCIVTRSFLAAVVRKNPDWSRALLVSRALDQTYNHQIIARRSSWTAGQLNRLIRVLEREGFADKLRRAVSVPD